MIKILYKSWTDLNCYSLIIKNWRWKSLFYFLLLTLISGFIMGNAIYSSLDNFFNKNFHSILEQIPTIKINDGNIFIDTKSPVIIKTNDNHSIFALSDRLLDPNEIKGLIFALEKNRITFYSENWKEESYSIKDLLGDSSISITKDDIKKIFENNIYISAIFYSASFLSAIFISFGTNLFILAILVPLCYISSLNLLPQLGIKGSLKIAIVSMTPAVLLQALGSILPYGEILGTMGIFATFFIAIRVIRKLANQVKSS